MGVWHYPCVLLWRERLCRTHFGWFSCILQSKYPSCFRASTAPVASGIMFLSTRDVHKKKRNLLKSVTNSCMFCLAICICAWWPVWVVPGVFAGGEKRRWHYSLMLLDSGSLSSFLFSLEMTDCKLWHLFCGCIVCLSCVSRSLVYPPC